MFDYKTDQNLYVVHSKKNGNEFIISFDNIVEVTNYVEKEPNVIGVWHVTSTKLPEGVYTRKVTK